jgi:hypothetical protein
MPYKMPGDTHVSRELTIVSTALKNQEAQFVADKIFPNIPVDDPTGFYNKMGRRSFLQTRAEKRAPRTETPGTDWTFTRSTYASEVWGLHHDIEDMERAANDNENWALDKIGTELITTQMLIRRELEWMDTYFKIGVWSENMTGVTAAPAANQFLRLDQAGSSPMNLFRKAKRRFNLRTGWMPNTLAIGPEAWDIMIDHPEIVDRVKNTQPGFLTEQLVAQAIGIKNIRVMEAVIATDDTDEDVTGAQEYPITRYLAGKDALLCYAAPRPSKQAPSAGYTFSWKGYLGANAFGGRIRKFRIEPIRCDRIEIESAYDYKVIAPELGTFMSGFVS